LTAALTGSLYLRLGWSFELLFWLPLAAGLLVVVFLDIDLFWVPDVITYPAMAWALAGSLLPGRLGIINALLGLGPAALLVLVAWTFKLATRREGMGLGDVKLLAALGLALGLRDGLSLMLWAAAQGTVVGVLSLLRGGHKPLPGRPEITPSTPVSRFDDGWTPPPRAMPFGPTLVLSAYEIVLFPEVFTVWPGQLANLIAKSWL
jgi:prepilin signal peptidase PulO-like enzyme (type II secretory pathway)